jgi:hypothetical protein
VAGDTGHCTNIRGGERVALGQVFDGMDIFSCQCSDWRIGMAFSTVQVLVFRFIICTCSSGWTVTGFTEGIVADWF